MLELLFVDYQQLSGML